MELLTYEIIQRIVVEVAFIWIVVLALFGLSYWIYDIVRTVSKWRRKRKQKEERPNE